jgi:hypothetical protein
VEEKSLPLNVACELKLPDEITNPDSFSLLFWATGFGARVERGAFDLGI